MAEKNDDIVVDVDNADLTDKEIADIENTVIVTEKMSDMNTNNIYKIKGTVVFDVSIDTEKDAQKEIYGKIHSDILLGDTKIYQVETWRFCVNNLSISNIHCDSTVDELVYDFTAKSFSVKA